MDHFSKFKKSKIKREDKKMKITNISEGNGYSGATVYGALTIPYNTQKMHEWTIKIIHGNTIAIGLDESNCKWTDTYFYGQQGTINYSYQSNGYKWDNGSVQNDGESYGHLDVIKMTLNGADKSLSFKKNGGKNTKFFTINPSKKGYKFCVFLYTKDESVLLSSYNCYQHDTEQKYNDTAIKIKRSKTVGNIGKTQTKKSQPIQQEKLRLEAQIAELKKITIKFQSDNRRLKEELNVRKQPEPGSTVDIKNENIILKQKVSALEDAINTQNDKYINVWSEKEQLKQTNFSLLKENKMLKENNGRLMDEQKEMQCELKELRMMMEKMRMKKIDTVNYMNWNWEQILIWIISLENGRYIGYESVLRQTLADEEIKGIHLIKVNESDVKGWGIKKFEDKKDLIQHIDKLVEQNQENVFNENDNHGMVEGYNPPTAYM